MINLTKKHRINLFWNWFNAHKYYYNSVDSGWDPGFKLLSEKLNQIDENADLMVMVQLNGDDERQLIISADGRLEDFPLVREVVNAAPEMLGWKAIAFQQPEEGGWIIRYKRYKLNTAQMYCLPLLDDDSFAVALYGKNLKRLSEEDSYDLAESILKCTLGEYHYATKITACYLQDMSESNKESILPLTKLHEFVMNNFMNRN